MTQRMQAEAQRCYEHSLKLAFGRNFSLTHNRAFFIFHPQPASNKPHVATLPQPEGEKAVLRAIETLKEAANTHDAQRVSKILHKDVKAPIGPRRKVLNKQEYLDLFPKRMAKRWNTDFENLEVQIRQDKAIVKCVMMATYPNRTLEVPMEFHLVREDGRWLISGWEY